MDETKVEFEKGRLVCRLCRKKQMKAHYDNNSEIIKQKATIWTANNREKYKQYAKKSKITNKDKNRNSYYLKRFGITLEEFNSLATAQNNLCKICNNPERTHKNLNVDHCHVTGKIRGLLCTSCNTALGLFKDLKSNLEQAIQYLDAL